MVNDRKGILEFPCDVERLENGNTLITDAGDEAGNGSEVMEVTPAGQIVWHYSDGLKFAHSAKRLNNQNTLIADTTGNRIIEVDIKGNMVFSSDNWSNGTGLLSDNTHLHYPNDVHMLDDGSYIITDRNNNRCIIANGDGEIICNYNKGIKHPHNCDMLKNGNVLIADSDGKRIIEVNRSKEIVWKYGDGTRKMLDWPRDADRLENGNTLVTDSRNSRIIEVSPEGDIVWEHSAQYFANFYDADLLGNGNVLISDQQHHQVLEVDRFGNVVWIFNNYVNPNKIHMKLTNGFFKTRKKDGCPENWILFNRFSEGGGKIIWDETEKRPCPGLEYDRPGVLSLQQVVAVRAGQRLSLAGKLKNENMEDESFSYLQLAFLDCLGGLVEDASKAPKGNLFTGDINWTEDSFEAVAPDNACAVEVRVTICGKGRVWVKNMMLMK
jgi:hypothetical protein